MTEQGTDHSPPAIRLRGVGKTYALYRRASDRLLELVSGRARHQRFVALEPLDLEVAPGEVLGLIGMNGAGKSTLLKIIAGTVEPSAGRREVHGRLSALLELGAGFHPEMSGRDNVYLGAAVLGLEPEQIDALYPEIVAFSGLADFMDQPVKTYSSGMFVRLAFSVATAVRPDILIVDEALSVGDGAFARQSFDRIMGFRDAGSTVLFCSHSLYQVEALCRRVIWVHHGRIVRDGAPSVVTAAYQQFLDTGVLDPAAPPSAVLPAAEARPAAPAAPLGSVVGSARLTDVRVRSDPGRWESGVWVLASGVSDLDIVCRFQSDPALPTPTLAATLVRADGSVIASAGSHNDGVHLPRSADGRGGATLRFEAIPLLKGEYAVSVYLMCERAVHIYDQAEFVARFRIEQADLEQGLVRLPHRWMTDGAQPHLGEDQSHDGSRVGSPS